MTGSAKDVTATVEERAFKASFTKQFKPVVRKEKLSKFSQGLDAAIVFLEKRVEDRQAEGRAGLQKVAAEQSMLKAGVKMFDGKVEDILHRLEVVEKSMR